VEAALAALALHRDIIPFFASDQDEFYAVDDPIPAAWFTSPGMAFYHTTGDTAEAIDYRSVREQSRFLLQALMAFADDPATYDYEGPPPIAPEHARDALEIIEGVQGSSYPGALDQEELAYLRGEYQAVIDSDTLDVLEDPEALFFYTIYFLCFELPAAHVGDIPPPFPE